MTPNQLNRKKTILIYIVILSMLGLIACIAVLFPHVRQMIMTLIEKILRRPIFEYQAWYHAFFSYALTGIFFILFFDYCTLTNSGRLLVNQVKQEIKDCLSEIDFRSFRKPFFFMLGVYLLGILTIIRANFLYMDDIGRSIEGWRGWYGWSRYVSEFASIFLHADSNLTDISPLPQLFAMFFLSISSVLLVYILGDRRITTVRLLASIPLGLFPYFLQNLSFKFDAPYMTLSILASIVPFLFIKHKKAFIFSSVVSLLIMCATYQASSGFYLLIAVILCFQDWNRRKKSDKEILAFLGVATFAFCIALAIFKIFLVRSPGSWAEKYASTSIHPIPNMLSGILENIKDYAIVVNQDMCMLWKIGIALVCIFFITKSVRMSSRKKVFSFFTSILLICLSFILSYGVYYLLTKPLYEPRSLYGFGLFLSLLCIYVVSDYKKIAIVIALALNWSFFVFAFSYGNALADQARYTEFRISMLLHDLSNLYPDQPEETISIQLENSIDFAPTIQNISKHYPLIEKLVYKRLSGGDNIWEYFYFLKHFNYGQNRVESNLPVFFPIDFRTLDLPVVLDSYYHTIKSDGIHCLVVLKH